MNNSRLIIGQKKSKKKWWITLSICGTLLVGGAASILYIYDWDPEKAAAGVSEFAQNTYASVAGQSTEEPAEQPAEEPVVDEPAEEEPIVEEEPAEETPIEEPQEPLTPEDVTEPTYIDGVLIASKDYPLPVDYAPGENEEAAASFEELAAAARQDGFELVAFSTFRSYEYQTELYQRYVDQHGQEEADRFSARPGYSEHQTGLGFDIGEAGQEADWASDTFHDTEAAKWLEENAHRFGFILRYPPGKEEITGYQYESWHFRYLGKELSEKVYDSGLTLEEYLGI